VCGNEYTVTANKTIRHHFTENPDFQAGPDSRKCKGVGEPPASAAGLALAEDMEADQPQCRLCKHPVELTGNGRARSHLTPEQTPRPCPGGSDFPLGTYPDLVGTTDGLVATLAADCEHVPVGQCYGCHGAAGKPVSDAELDAMAEAEGTGAAPWGVDPAAVQQPTMADQFKDAAESMTCGCGASWPSNEEMQKVGHGLTQCPKDRAAGPSIHSDGGYPYPAVTSLTEAEQFKNAAPATHSGGGLSAAEQERLAAVVATDYRSPERKAADARMSELTREAVKVLQQRSPEEKAETAARMDRTASAALGVPLDPALNHNYTDPSGTVWTHEGPEETCQAPDCVALRAGLPEGFDPNCEQCDTDNHRCPGCGTDVPHGAVACAQCTRETCMHPNGFQGTADDYDSDGQDRVVSTCAICGAMDPEDELPDDERPTSGPALLSELEDGDHFIRRGAVMRVVDTDGGILTAVVVEGPRKGLTGELFNVSETVERTHCRHDYSVPDGDGGYCCDYCGDLKTTTEQETKECPSNKTTSPRSSAASATSSTATATPTSPAHGSPQGAGAPAPAVLPESNPVTSSGPTATAGTRVRSAAVTTDQSAAAAAFLGSGRPSAPASTGAQNQADAAAQFLAGGSGSHGEVETKRDRYGRYLIPHPDTGKEKAWTRSTTFAKSISDTYALSQWGLRMALLGATVRPDIVQRAHGKHVKADKALLDELTAELKNAAGDKVAANLGTAMHSFTELADRAWHSPGGPRSIMDQVPPDCRADVETYIRLLEETGLEPVPGLIEFTTVVKQYGVAGTSDNCYKVTKPLTLKIGRAEVRLEPGEYVIGDKKTGKDLDYGWQEIVIQLATYAQGINTSGVWDKRAEEWIPDPLNGAKVRTDTGVVVHLPVDKESEKTPAVYGVDLESGWQAAVLCERVREWRKLRTLASPVMVSEADTFAPARLEPTVVTRTTVRQPTLKDKALAVTSKGDASAVWKEAKTAGLPDTEVDELVAVMQKRLKELAEPGG
jgi:hypothetical protein